MICPDQKPVERLLSLAERTTVRRWSELGIHEPVLSCLDAGFIAEIPESAQPPDRDIGVDMAKPVEEVEQPEEPARKVKAHVVAEPEPEPEPDPEPEPELAVAPPAKVVPQQASLGVPAPDVDVKKLVEDSQGASAYTVLLAVVAVAGGGAAWKFYQNWSKNKHEQAMKALEIEQSKVDKQQNDHQTCAAKNAAVTAQVDSLSAKVAELSGKVAAIPEHQPDLGASEQDVEKLSKRVRTIERKLGAVEAKVEPKQSGKAKR